MYKLIITFIVFALYTNVSKGQQSPSLSAVPKYFLDIQTGYANYFSISVSGTIANFTYDIPLAIKFGASYNVRDAGDPWAARKIFINDNTNGDPEKSGHSFDLRVDSPRYGTKAFRQWRDKLLDKMSKRECICIEIKGSKLKQIKERKGLKGKRGYRAFYFFGWCAE